VKKYLPNLNSYFVFICLLALFSFLKFALPTSAQTTSFSFSAAGDHGSTTNSNTRASFDTLTLANVDFHLGLGDMSYMSPGTESSWCDFVKSKVGANFPFEIVAGNHEDDGPNGLIENFATCLPHRMNNLAGTYAKEYYFNYPQNNPLARFIMISPDLTFSNGEKFDYTSGSRRTWLINAIDSARNAGIPWVIVGMHKNCITAGDKSCEIGASLMNLLIDKRVDLVLQGHDHNYQRSKQLTCATVNNFNATCVADDGSDNKYVKGAGTIFLIVGTFGAGHYDINTSDSEAQYFAALEGANANETYGFAKVTLSQNELTSQFIRSRGGTFTDNFTIEDTSISDPSPQPSGNTIANPDANSDGHIDVQDALILLNNYSGLNKTVASGDFFIDQKVNNLDFGVWFARVSQSSPLPSTSIDPILAASGDMVCGAQSTGAACKQMQTSDLLVAMNPDAVLPLGDVQYEEGSLIDFQNFYEPSWGRVKDKTYPIVGNHEYLTSGAAGYFDYFNGIGNQTGPAGDRDKGYYAFNLGTWRIYILNSNCSKAGGCGTGSPQETWLRTDLAANPKNCVLAAYHHPLHTSGSRASTSVSPLFKALYDAGAEIVLAGHEHNYERFAMQDVDANLDPVRGIREFVVGTGGRNFTQFTHVAANSEVRNDRTFGVLKMVLHSNSYDWQFLPVAGSTFTDSGSTNCH